ncbi:glycosyltransferase [uncultured Muribaculum sp.]|uniref:glycosyltransferase n=1 Tax=uncultured Muribaculum sp. TaxID=1918613 RepID=UPI002660200D|nr:glycosyltransferase [uncultured Muribaculum sp.]
MKLLYISTFLFHKENGNTYGLPANADSFFGKYLDVFDSVRVLGDKMSSYLDVKGLSQMIDSHISVELIPSNTHPSDFKNDKRIRQILHDEISKAEAVLIKPSTRKGMMAIKIAKELGKPYMIEMTGDIHNALRQNSNFMKRLYAPFLYRSIKNAIADAPFGLYVSRDYLQSQFPIRGEMCGCSDVILDFSAENILTDRLQLIESITSERQINLALIGFYQGKMKGVDTAIRALARLPQHFHLNILGNGTEENREKWYRYADRHGIKNPKYRISFPRPLKSSTEVLNWLDTQDFFVFPTLSEGLPRCLVEAISRGCVCFATNICTMPELLDESCLFPKHRDDILSQLILEYASDKDKLKEMAMRNYQHSKNYAPDILRKRRNEFLERFRLFCEEHNSI